VQTLSHVSPLVCGSFEAIVGLVSARDGKRRNSSAATRRSLRLNVPLVQDCKFESQNSELKVSPWATTDVPVMRCRFAAPVPSFLAF
jgi:hypothetical protein